MSGTFTYRPSWVNGRKEGEYPEEGRGSQVSGGRRPLRDLKGVLLAGKGVRGHPQGFRSHWEGCPVASRWAAATARLSQGRLEGVCAGMRQAVLPTPVSHGRWEGALRC